MSASIKKVILCADGDSTDINLWSNIPFLLAAELEHRGIKVVRINLKQPLLLRRLWRYIFGPFHKLRHWNTSFDFFRSRINYLLTTRRLNKAVRRNSSPDTILINLSISSSPSVSSIPVVLLSDWSYHYYITEHLHRNPDLSEQATIHRDHAAMARSSLVVLLFPESAARLQRQIPKGSFRFLGHVINDHPLAPPVRPQLLIHQSRQPWRLLFVGRQRYLSGLRLLLDSLSLLPDAIHIQLDIIGMDLLDFSLLGPQRFPVNFHGYLSKEIADERRLYYALMNNADLVINASSIWGGFSATVEAMHRYTAVITPPYSEFRALFGHKISFGSYLSDLTPSCLSSSIADLLLDSQSLQQKKQNAHEAVKSFTWKNFVTRLLADISSLPPERQNIVSPPLSS